MPKRDVDSPLILNSALGCAGTWILIFPKDQGLRPSSVELKETQSNQRLKDLSTPKCRFSRAHTGLEDVGLL